MPLGRDGTRVCCTGVEPFNVCAEELVHGAHETDLEFSCEEALKSLLDSWVFGEVHNIVDVDTKMEGLVGGRSWGVGQGRYTLE